MEIKKFNKKPKVLFFQGSPRDIDTCPNMESKTHLVVEYLLDKYKSKLDIEVIDLSVNQNKKPTIQPCKGCVSTAGGYHCHWKCDCYFKGSKKKPDLLSELDIYSKLEECDAFIVFSPIHWNSITSQVKALFDRLVCANLSLTKEKAKELFGKDTKNSDVTGPAKIEGKYDELLKNHLEGKIAGFYIHGDNGADDYKDKKYPDTLTESDNNFNPKDAIMPIVFQCRYSAINVPDELIEAFYINEGIDYYTSNINIDDEFFKRGDKLIMNLFKFIR